jgi:drug/metabolite transporter (DMT)-like permease
MDAAHPGASMRTILLVVVGSLVAGLGEALLSKGMKELGDVGGLGWTGLWKMVRMFSNPRVLLGVAFLAGFFFLYAAALSWADLSYVMPGTALSLVFGTTFAALFLGERVSVWRWAGVAVIVFGVLLVWKDEKVRTAPPAAPAPKHPTGQIRP